ncbi:MAG: FAD-dependent thymidylate synthase [Deltaproteobacteria bacterium]|nr:FAD-dependent thymidylate synthase [Deltaproteobacteria bacterium]
MTNYRSSPDSHFARPPRVALLWATPRSYEESVAAARTCYSGGGVVRAAQVSGDGLLPEQAQARREQRDRIAASTYAAGHHTTLQHGHASFALDDVSRQFVWSFLHAHPFYNSEQVSQRYVEVRSDRVALPLLPAPAAQIYRECVERQTRDYQALIALLEPVAAAEYFSLFRARAKRPERWRSAIHKRAQEVARYVLPLGTHTWLVHTISVLTLLRYRRLCLEPDTPTEAREVVFAMCDALFEHDPLLRNLGVEPMPAEALPVWKAAAEHGAEALAMAREFDEQLGDRTSLLLDRFADNPRRVADAVRQVLGLPRARLSDGEAIALALDPKHNPLLGESLQTVHHQKLGRALSSAHYAFAKKLSHAADSQDQRHRMTPAARPLVQTLLGPEPDFAVPRLIRPAGGRAEALYRQSMDQTWQAIAELENLGISHEFRAYLLPNAVHVRMTETSDLQALRHKHAMRLCFNAQEEIWQASLEEAQQIAAVEPELGRWLLPPCAVRFAAGIRPICPEGDRYCGVPVWQQDPKDWNRLL